MEAEGCFFVKIQKNKNTENFQIKLGCQITQHNKDSRLIKSLIPFFNCPPPVQPILFFFKKIMGCTGGGGGRLETTKGSYIQFVVTENFIFPIFINNLIK